MKVEARINEEADRATHYLDESTEARIVEVSTPTPFLRILFLGV